MVLETDEKEGIKIEMGRRRWKHCWIAVVAVLSCCLARREKEALERDAGEKERGHTKHWTERSPRDLYVGILGLCACQIKNDTSKCQNPTPNESEENE